jgi:hypothetical protein
MTDEGGFYEEDEATEDVVAAFQRGEKGVTARPASPFFFVGESINAGCYAVVSAPPLANHGFARWTRDPANVATPDPDRISATA